MSAKTKTSRKKLVNKRTVLNSKKVKNQVVNTRPLVFILLFAIIGAVLIIKSYAAPSGNKGAGKPTRNNGTLAIEMVTDTNGDGAPSYGEQIKFNVYTPGSAEPHVSAQCYQNGTLVYSAQAGYFDGYPWPWSQTFTLKSNAWVGGGANCTAKGYYFDGRKTIYFATLDFIVNP